MLKLAEKKGEGGLTNASNFDKNALNWEKYVFLTNL